VTTSQLQHFPAAIASPAQVDYRVVLAASSDEVLAAQQLRFRVFELECGASTPGPSGVDVDMYDDLCDHLIVRADRNDFPGAPSEVVATYRLLPPHANDATPRESGLYSNSEFDLRALRPLLGDTVEAGRSCVAVEHRGPGPISLMWRGIANYMAMTGHRYLMGCASISLSDGGDNAAAFADLVQRMYRAPAEKWCPPRVPFEPSGILRPSRPLIPPLVRGYLRLGALVCGPPALDTRFHTADFLLLLDLAAADSRYLRFFGIDPAMVSVGRQ